MMTKKVMKKYFEMLLKISNETHRHNLVDIFFWGGVNLFFVYQYIFNKFVTFNTVLSHF